MKHHTDWKVEQRPGGILVWTGPTRRTYVDRPPGMPHSTRTPGVHFDDEPEPPRHPLRRPAEYGEHPEF